MIEITIEVNHELIHTVSTSVGGVVEGNRLSSRRVRFHFFDDYWQFRIRQIREILVADLFVREDEAAEAVFTELTADHVR